MNSHNTPPKSLVDRYSVLLLVAGCLTFGFGETSGFLTESAGVFHALGTDYTLALRHGENMRVNVRGCGDRPLAHSGNGRRLRQDAKTEVLVVRQYAAIGGLVFTLPSLVSTQRLQLTAEGLNRVQIPTAPQILSDKPRRETADCGRGEERAVGENYGVIVSTTNPESITPRDSVSFAPAQESNSSVKRFQPHAQTVSAQNFACPRSVLASTPLSIPIKLSVAGIYVRLLDAAVTTVEPPVLEGNKFR